MFTIKDFYFDKYNGLSISNKNLKLNLLFQGLTILDLYISVNNSFINLIEGYKNVEEFETFSGARSCLMAPYSNKIRNFTYTFNAKEYKFNNFIDDNLKYHGLIKFKKFELKSCKEVANGIELIFSTTLNENEFDFYPFKTYIDVILYIDNSSLNFEIVAQNTNNFDIPFGAGWHPYFKLISRIDDCYLKIPSKTIVELDNDFCPLENYKKILEKNYPLYFFDTYKLIGDQKINVCFTDLIVDKNNFAHTIFFDKQNNLYLNIYQNKGVIYIFTGDGLKYRERESIAIEPVEFITDSFNRKELYKDLLIKPNKKKSFIFGLKWSNYE